MEATHVTIGGGGQQLPTRRVVANGRQLASKASRRLPAVVELLIQECQAEAVGTLLMVCAALLFSSVVAARQQQEFVELSHFEGSELFKFSGIVAAAGDTAVAATEAPCGLAVMQRGRDGETWAYKHLVELPFYLVTQFKDPRVAKMELSDDERTVVVTVVDTGAIEAVVAVRANGLRKADWSDIDATELVTYHGNTTALLAFAMSMGDGDAPLVAVQVDHTREVEPAAPADAALMPPSRRGCPSTASPSLDGCPPPSSASAPPRIEPSMRLCSASPRRAPSPVCAPGT